MDVCEDWNSESSVELARLKFSHKTVVGRLQYGADLPQERAQLVNKLLSVLAADDEAIPESSKDAVLEAVLREGETISILPPPPAG